jgi:hypothetical protein
MDKFPPQECKKVTANENSKTKKKTLNICCVHTGILHVASSWLPKIQQDLLIRSTESTPVMNDQFSMRIS